MPYIKRGDDGSVVAVSLEQSAGFNEEMDSDSPELAAFFGHGGQGVALAGTDQDFIRVLEDVVDLLIDKGVFLFTELPASAQAKILQRQKLRSAAGSSLDLLGDD